MRSGNGVRLPGSACPPGNLQSRHDLIVLDSSMLYKSPDAARHYILTRGICMKKLSSILAACTIVAATAAFGANRSEQFSISPVIGGYTFDGRQHLDSSLIFGVRAGYNVTDNFG